MANKFVLTLDASQISMFQTCPLKWYYAYKQNLALAGAKTVAPDKGTLIHNLCDMYYNLRWLAPNGNKLSQASSVIEFYKKSNTTKTLFPEDDGTLDQFLCERFMLYVNRYMNDDFVLAKSAVSPAELGFSKKLYEDDLVLFILEGKIDLVNIIMHDVPCFTDHKTQSMDNTLYAFKPQFKTYALATGYEYGIINYIGMQEDKSNKILTSGRMFKRQLIHFPKWMIQEWEKKLISIFWFIAHTMKESMDPEYSLYSQRNDNSCSGAFDSNPCVYTSLCEEPWDFKEKIKSFKYKVREPWSPWNVKEVKVNG